MEENAFNQQREETTAVHRASIRFDLDSGNFITTVKSEDPVAPMPDEMAVNIANAVKSAFQKIADDTVLQIQTAAHNTDYSELLRILEATRSEGRLLLASHEALIKIYNLIQPVSVRDLPSDQMKELVHFKLFFAGKLGDFTGLYEDISIYLQTFRDEIDNGQRRSLVLAQANCAAQEGKAELAYNLYHVIIREVQVGETLAWAYRGLANILDPADPDSLYFEELAADCFLQSGKKRSYISSKIRCADKVRFSNPESALNILDAAIEVCNKEDALECGWITSLRLEKAKIYDLIDNDNSALGETQAALKTHDLQHQYGLEPLLISVLNAAIIFSQKGEHEDPEFIHSAQKNICSLESRLQENDKVEYEVRKKLLTALNKKDANLLHEASECIEDLHDELLSILYWIVDILISGDSFIQKLEKLEQLSAMAKTAQVSQEITAIICALYAENYYGNGNQGKALEWYKQALDVNPFLWFCRQSYIALLWKTGKWNEAASFLEKQVERFGDLPNLLFAYGKSLVEIKAYGKAIPILRKAQKKLPDMQAVTDCLNTALDLCDESNFSNIDSRNIPTEKARFTLEDFKIFLHEFTEHIQSEVRMAFWQSVQGKGHKWVSSPEKHGQTLLHTFMKSRYGDSVEVLEEVSTGAGRIDLFVRFTNGFRTVIELKMCGHGYSEGYSLEGLEQLKHYLDNQKLCVGYLLIFDSRVRDFSKGICPIYFLENKMIYTEIVDIRPSIK